MGVVTWGGGGTGPRIWRWERLPSDGRGTLGAVCRQEPEEIIAAEQGLTHHAGGLRGGVVGNSSSCQLPGVGVALLALWAPQWAPQAWWALETRLSAPVRPVAA